MNQRHALVALCLLLLSFGLSPRAQAQLLGQQSDVPLPTWRFYTVPASGEYKVGDVIELHFEGTPKEDWHLYGPKSPDGAFRETTVEFKDAKGFKPVGDLIGQGKKVEEYDEIMEGKIIYFKGKATFVQKVKVTDENLRVVGRLDFQYCRESQCVFDKFKFDEKLTAKTAGSGDATATTDDEALVSADDGEDDEAADDEEADAEDEAAAEKKRPDSADPDNDGIAEEAALAAGAADSDCETDVNLWAYFFLALGGGIVALVTPCVFPLIPMTVSFFTKQSKTRQQGIVNAFIYTLSIVVLFTGIGTLITVLLGPQVPYLISINPWVNMVFFALLFIFALAFFGWFEIELPSSWSTKMDKMSERGGILGIFFMAMTLVIASFSCTGPIIGTALVGASSAGACPDATFFDRLAPTVMMLGFSLGFGLPFGLFALFPGMMNSMPKSGGWLNSVKVTLGFLELAFALKFLLIADQIWHWGWLTRDIYLAIWITIFILLALYLLGKFRLPHDTMPLEKLSVPRMLIALLSLSFAVYLLPGMFGQPLSGLSGFLPPPQRSMGVHLAEDQFNVLASGETGGDICDMDRLYAEDYAEETPLGYCAFYDLDEARAYAKKQNKPLFIDFTGITCVNCREMEQRVWPKTEVMDLLGGEFVMVSLYADDPRPLLEPITTPEGDELETRGDKWRYLEIKHFGQLTQPLYVLSDPHVDNLKASKLNDPVGYTPDVDEYMSFLREGLKVYNKRHKKGGE